MLLARAAASLPASLSDERETVTTAAALAPQGWTDAAIDSQLRARRWQRVGRAIVRHNGVISPAEKRQVALVNCGPRGVLTAFTAVASHGLTGWERDEVHVLVPGGARVRRVPALAMRVHYTGDWPAVEQFAARRLHAAAPALVLAAATFTHPRAACGLLAAGVQQRLVTAAHLLDALTAAPRVRHRSLLLAAARDIECGAEALSEIDFVRLCGRQGLPRPAHQAVRREASGRRRYLDAEWRRSDGQTVSVEVDGAIHLAIGQWVADQLRQNELVLGGALLLRYPSVMVRTEPELVASQLRRALHL